MAAFDSHERGDFAFLMGFTNFGGGSRQHQIFRMLLHLVQDGTNLLDGMFDGFGPSDLAGDPDGEKDCAKAAFAHARYVYAAIFLADSKIELRVQHALGGVVVSIDND
jgi:hypothetical protein